MSRIRSQDGFTLVELLTAMLIFTLVLGATLTTLDGFVTRAGTNTKVNDAQDQARFTVERIVRQVRNLASPSSSSVKSIDKAADYDLVFQTVDPSLRRIRYCLRSDDPADGTLWVQTQAFDLTGPQQSMPSTTACPGTGWATQKVAARHVVNQVGGRERPIFYYNVPAGSDTAKITGIRAELFMDVNGADKAPLETNIASGDFLRNQNQSPAVPDFEMTRSGPRTFILNGSEASDPEGRTLDYFWYSGTGDTASLPACTDSTNQTGGGFTCLGRSLTLSHTFPESSTGVQTVTLRVVDPGGLSAVLSKSTPSLGAP